MAKKAQTKHLGIATFVLAALCALGGAGVLVFNVGKDVGAYEERLVQLERRTSDIAIVD